MKTFTFLILATFISVNSFLSQTPEESPELKQASDLTASAVKLFKEQKYDEAASQAKKGLEIREKLLPPTDPQIIMSLSYLADIYITKRDFGEAKKVLERLLDLQAQRTSPDHVYLAPTFERLALSYYRQGDERKSEEMYKRALAVREKAFGAESVRVADSLYALGEFYRAEKDYERAASNYRRSLLIYGKVSGINTPEFERASDGLSCLAWDGRPDLGKDLKEIWKQFGPPRTPEDSLGNRILNGMAIDLPKPVYPVGARERNLSGIVVVKVKIDETGKVISAHDMCKGPPYLSQAAVAAAWQARFTPTKLSGMPVKVNGVIQYRFVKR